MNKTFLLAVLPATLSLAACGVSNARPEPIVRTVEIKVPTIAPCVPKSHGPAPEYPDSDEALRNAMDAADRYLLLVGGRELRQARESELEAIIAGCPKG